MIKKILLWLGFVTIFFYNTSSTFAQEAVIDSNGPTSDNQINLTQTNSTTIEQNNNSEINNSLNTQADTGSNNASSNNSNSTISTGDVQSSTSVQNSANSSSVDTSCCPANGTDVQISNNGPGSTNNIDLGQDIKTNIAVNQYAAINNEVTGTTNSGFNNSSFNNGSSTVSTGDIFASNQIKNSNINNSSIEAASATQSDVNIKIWGNGPFSSNQADLQFKNNNLLNVLNRTSLNNILNFSANTGHNNALFNNSDVFITTGIIYLDNIIKNVDINTSKILISCNNCESSPPPNPTSGGENPTGGNNTSPQDTTNNPTTTSSNSPSGGGPGSGGGGEVLGAILPSTGDNTLIGLTLLMLMVFIYGLKLVIESEKSTKNATLGI